MSIPDLINGAFELTGGFVCLLDVKRLLRDRRIEGVDWRVRGFFLSWGVWNLFYYPTFQQWASLAGGITLAAVNGVWVYLAVKLQRKQKWLKQFEPIRWSRHMRHKAFDPTCEFCQRALGGLRSGKVTALNKLPEIKHTYKCECELCQELDNDARTGANIS